MRARPGVSHPDGVSNRIIVDGRAERGEPPAGARRDERPPIAEPPPPVAGEEPAPPVVDVIAEMRRHVAAARWREP